MLLVGWTADGQLWDERVVLTCDMCGQAFTALEAAWLAFPEPSHAGERVCPSWAHRHCAERQAHPEGIPHLWRADRALKAMLKQLQSPAAIPRAGEPSAEASKARRATPSAADKTLMQRLTGQRWSVEELRWVATHLDHQAPLVVEQMVHARLRELEAASLARAR